MDITARTVHTDVGFREVVFENVRKKMEAVCAANVDSGDPLVRTSVQRHVLITCATNQPVYVTHVNLVHLETHVRRHALLIVTSKVAHKEMGGATNVSLVSGETNVRKYVFVLKDVIKPVGCLKYAPAVPIGSLERNVNIPALTALANVNNIQGFVTSVWVDILALAATGLVLLVVPVNVTSTRVHASVEQASYTLHVKYRARQELLGRIVDITVPQAAPHTVMPQMVPVTASLVLLVVHALCFPE